MDTSKWNVVIETVAPQEMKEADVSSVAGALTGGGRCLKLLKLRPSSWGAAPKQKKGWFSGSAGFYPASE